MMCEGDRVCVHQGRRPWHTTAQGRPVRARGGRTSSWPVPTVPPSLPTLRSCWDPTLNAPACAPRRRPRCMQTRPRTGAGTGTHEPPAAAERRRAARQRHAIISRRGARRGGAIAPPAAYPGLRCPSPQLGPLSLRAAPVSPSQGAMAILPTRLDCRAQTGPSPSSRSLTSLICVFDFREGPARLGPREWRRSASHPGGWLDHCTRSI